VTTLGYLRKKGCILFRPGYKTLTLHKLSSDWLPSALSIRCHQNLVMMGVIAPTQNPSGISPLQSHADGKRTLKVYAESPISLSNETAEKFKSQRRKGINTLIPEVKRMTDAQKYSKFTKETLFQIILRRIVKSELEIRETERTDSM
jgi:hypothetical protein